MPSYATSWHTSSHSSVPAANSCGPLSLRPLSRPLKQPSSKPYVTEWKFLTCSDEPASVPTGPVAASATSSSSSNTATAPRESRTVAPARLPLPLVSRAMLRWDQGEALAVAWGLQQTRYLTQGCERQPGRCYRP